MDSRPKDKKTITIKEVESFLQHTVSSIKALQSAVGILPPVDKEGNSKCPSAKELYEKKEEAQKTVANCLEKLHDYAKWTAEQISRCKNNLVVISANSDRLNNDLPRHDFSEAEVKLAAMYKRLIRLQLKIKKAIKQCQQAIRDASKKRYPSGDDKKGSVPNDSEDSLEDEVADEPTDKQTDELLHQMLKMGPVE